MTKYLRCHTNGYDVTKGKEYAIIEENDRSYKIIDDVKDRHAFTKKPDINGESYCKWFTLETESIEAVTLLPDESLGGLMREYNEVKRKARVGERIKIVNNGAGHRLKIGSTYVADGADSAENWMLYHAEERANPDYVVLEPSDIIRIDDTDGVNRGYRMVERKAAVGERVVVTKEPRYDNRFNRGEVYDVIYDDGCTQSILVKHQQGYHGVSGGARLSEYRVLEPLESNAFPMQTTRNQPPLSTLDPVDQYANNIATLTTKVQALEERVATLEESASNAKVASGPVNSALPSFAKKTGITDLCASLAAISDFATQLRRVGDLTELSVTESELKAWVDVIAPKKTDQQVRDEIVARAKADVERLRDVFGDYEVDQRYACNAIFHVNDTKRKVTIILTGVNSGKIRAVGRAICAPGEVFNVHIGRAIALHRALGLEVPAEYMSVPAPTEVRVGDIITFPSVEEDGVSYEVLTLDRRTDNMRILTTYFGGEVGGYANGGNILDGVAILLDDSREESEGVNA